MKHAKKPLAHAALWKVFKARRTSAAARLAARNALAELYLPLLHFHAQKFHRLLPETVELDDLVQAGFFGLLQALEGFQPARGVKFESYSVLRIRGAMLDELRQGDWVPRLVRAKATKLAKQVARLSIRLGRPPSEQELCEALEVEASDLAGFMPRHVESLERPMYESESGRAATFADDLADPRGEDPTRAASRLDALRLATKGLNQDERLIVILYYLEGLTMKEIGRTLELSESRVSQLHSALLGRLATRLAGRQEELAA